MYLIRQSQKMTEMIIIQNKINNIYQDKNNQKMSQPPPEYLNTPLIIDDQLCIVIKQLIYSIKMSQLSEFVAQINGERLCYTATIYIRGLIKKFRYFLCIHLFLIVKNQKTVFQRCYHCRKALWKSSSEMLFNSSSDFF